MTAPIPTRLAPPPGTSLPAKVQTIPPNQTLYVTNLPSAKIQKSDLRTALYLLFSTYGSVLDIVALKTMKMRGQAHIVYRDIPTATQAMRALNGKEFLGKKLEIQYAKSKSHHVAKLDGTFRANGSGAAEVAVTELQQSIFNAPTPGTTSTTAPRPEGAPLQPLSQSKSSSHPGGEGAEADARGLKRPREDDEAAGPATAADKKASGGPDAMEESDDSDVAMDEDSDDEE